MTSTSARSKPSLHGTDTGQLNDWGPVWARAQVPRWSVDAMTSSRWCRHRSARFGRFLRFSGGSPDSRLLHLRDPPHVTFREDLSLLHRERVDAQLERLFELSGGEVTGPVGCGKSSAVRAWASTTRLAEVTWLSIQQRHRDSTVLAAESVRRPAAGRPCSCTRSSRL